MNCAGLPEATAQAIQKRGKRLLVSRVLKCLVFYAVFMTILFVTERNNDLFTRETQPVWFWGIFVILVLLPLWKWKLYQLITCHNCYGTVERFRSRRAIGNEDGEYTGGLSGAGLNFRYIDACTMVVRSSKGWRHRFVAYNEKANVIRSNYQVGDRVFCPMFAAYPFNISRAPERPFCLCCGYVGTQDETVCPACDIPFVRNPAEDAKTACKAETGGKTKI